MSNTAKVKAAGRPRLSVKIQALAALLSIAAAVLLPQIFHWIGSVSGMGAKLGEVFLPMHIPVILAGLIAGPYAGLAAGLFSPLVSYIISGMPGVVMLPFMIVELAFYGLVSGLLSKSKFPAIGKVIAVQIAGRLMRAAAILLAVYAFGSGAVSVAVIWNSISVGLPGIMLQLLLMPLMVFWVRYRQAERSKNT